MLLYRLHRIALSLQAFRPWCMGLALCGAALACYALFDSPGHSTLLRLSLALTLWLLMLFSFIQLFRNIPPPVLPKDSFPERLRARVKLAFYHLLALALGLLGVGVFAMSVKLFAAR